jgi:hypothetical protein
MGLFIWYYKMKFKLMLQHISKKQQKTIPRHHRVLRTIGLIIVIWMFVIAISGWLYQYQHRGQPYEFGVSFAVRAAKELGSDWKTNFTALLDELGIRHYRLMSYWYDIEPERNKYDFADLDWQMNEAGKRGAKVMLAIGLRQPRWPECHTPEWAKSLERDERNEELFAYMSAVVQRYSKHPALESYQLENEYYNRNFGECDDYSRERLQTEYDMVRSLDPRHPLHISLSDQLGFPMRGPVPEAYATSMYRATYAKYIGFFKYPIPAVFYSSKAWYVEQLHGRRMFIHELQLEPWGPKPTAQLSVREQDKYMGMEQVKDNVSFGKRIGMRRIYLWGGEWWYWRKTTHKDPSIWETVRAELENH